MARKAFSVCSVDILPCLVFLAPGPWFILISHLPSTGQETTLKTLTSSGKLESSEYWHFSESTLGMYMYSCNNAGRERTVQKESGVTITHPPVRSFINQILLSGFSMPGWRQEALQTLSYVMLPKSLLSKVSLGPPNRWGPGAQRA